MNGTASLPIDVRLMNLTATVLYALCGVALVAAFGWWVLRHPLFALRAIAVEGELVHNNVPTLRANAAPRLAGSFFTLDLQHARQVFESVPWVREASVRRQFPDRLRVQLEEHRPVAHWGDTESRLVNSFGEVFEANVGEVEHEGMPRLAGPDGSAPQVWALYRQLAPLFEGLDLEVEQLVLTHRGSWVLHLDTAAVVELGRGNENEVLERSRAFVRTLTQVTSQYGRRPDALVSADLRHADGYAIRLRGVGTTELPAAQKK